MTVALATSAAAPVATLLAAVPIPGLGVTLLAPWGLALGALAAAGLVALHAITVGRPRPRLLPTARFAADRPARAVRHLARPSDRALLAVRALAAACAAVALARPVPTPARRAVARVLVADVSPAADPAAVRRAVRSLARPGDALIPFDGAPRAPLLLDAGADARTVEARVDSTLGSAVDASAGARPSAAPASLSAALVAARRVAARVAERADSVELVLVSPLARDAVDAATADVRATWGGRLRLVRVARSPGDTMRAATPARVALVGAPRDDALAAALALAGVRTDASDGRDRAQPTVRVLRGVVGAADSAWVRGTDHVLVAWPTDGAPAAARRRTADTAHALVAGTHAVVAPFARPAAWDEPARDRDTAPGGTRVVARWADGTPAAIERPLGRGCVRTVAVALPQVGDVALRASFGGVLGTLLAPCGGRRDTTALTAAEARRLAGAGPLLAAAPLRAAAGSGEADRLGAALLGAALVLLLAELALRARRRPVSGGAAEATGGTEGPPSRTAPDPAPDTAREAA